MTYPEFITAKIKLNKIISETDSEICLNYYHNGSTFCLVLKKNHQINAETIQVLLDFYKKYLEHNLENL